MPGFKYQIEQRNSEEVLMVSLLCHLTDEVGKEEGRPDGEWLCEP